MKSVGEAMAFGRTFQESFQKVRRGQRRTVWFEVPLTAGKKKV